MRAPPIVDRNSARLAVPSLRWRLPFRFHSAAGRCFSHDEPVRTSAGHSLHPIYWRWRGEGVLTSSLAGLIASRAGKAMVCRVRAALIATLLTANHPSARGSNEPFETAVRICNPSSIKTFDTSAVLAHFSLPLRLGGVSRMWLTTHARILVKRASGVSFQRPASSFSNTTS